MCFCGERNLAFAGILEGVTAREEVELKIAPGVVLADKYRLLRELGRGGVGVVYEAEHLRLRQRVALKIMSRAIAKEANVTARFEREARAMATLRSPFVTAVSDVDVLPDGTPYMVMELLDGRDLQRELRERGPLPIGEAAQIMLLACRGLAAVHAAGIVHRDLKPSNLFLVSGPALSVKVMDFGVSKMSDDDILVTHDGSTLGTPAYMAPEQVRSARDADPRADVWSLGVILFRCLTGRLPFEGEGITGMAVAITNNPPLSLVELRPDVPRGLASLVERMLVKDPAARIESVAAVAEELVHYTDAEYVESDDTDPKFTLPNVADEPAEHVTSHVRPSSPDLADAASAASGMMSLTPPEPPRKQKSATGFFVVLVLAVVGVVMAAGALIAQRVTPPTSPERPLAPTTTSPASTAATIVTTEPASPTAAPSSLPSSAPSTSASASASAFAWASARVPTAPPPRAANAPTKAVPRKPTEPTGSAVVDPALPPLL